MKIIVQEFFITYFYRSGRWNIPYRCESIESNSASCSPIFITNDDAFGPKTCKDIVETAFECLGWVFCSATCVIIFYHLWQTTTRIGCNIFTAMGDFSTPASIEICYEKFLHNNFYESVQPIVYDVKTRFSISLL